MRVALLNPPWRFDRSIYFGCREPHLPLELAWAKVGLEQRGHTALMLDGHLNSVGAGTLAAEVLAFRPGMIVVSTAPSYLFWRCAPPELTVPRALLRHLEGSGAITVAIGPHGSATPRTVLRKLGVDVVVRGEPDETIVDLADAGFPERVPGAARHDGDEIRVNCGPAVASFVDLAPLR